MCFCRAISLVINGKFSSIDSAKYIVSLGSMFLHKLKALIILSLDIMNLGTTVILENNSIENSFNLLFSNLVLLSIIFSYFSISERQKSGVKNLFSKNIFL
mgnify:CR=1 FL=1